MSEAVGANATQQAYWNNVAGPRWVRLGHARESRTRAVTGLLLRRAAPTPGEKVLEVGCGTGAATVPLAKAVGPQGEVLGLDISAPMLEAARARIEGSGLRNIALVEGDAQTHALPEARFDLIASRFGVMFFSDPAAAFANLRKAARPGGRLCFACWGSLDDNPQWLIPYRVAVRHVGPPAPKPASTPGPMAYADPDYVRSFLRAAGFAEIEIDREAVTVFGSTPREEAEHACLMGPPGRLIDEKKPDAATLEAIRREMEEAFAAHAQGAEMRLAGTVLLVAARCPA
jgi:SAM-dependent methyltransferase